MNIKLVVCEKQLLCMYVMDHFLCSDIIQMIIQKMYPFFLLIEAKQSIMNDLWADSIERKFLNTQHYFYTNAPRL